MTRSQPRRSPVKRGRKRSAYSRRPRNFEYMGWVKTQPCCRCGAPPPVQAHHAGTHGMSRKPPDETCIPLCQPCHESIDLLDGWRDKAERGEWIDDQISEHRSRYLAASGGF